MILSVFIQRRWAEIGRQLFMCERKKMCLPWGEIVNFCWMWQECLPEIDWWASYLWVWAYIFSMHMQLWGCVPSAVLSMLWSRVHRAQQETVENFGAVGKRGKLCGYLHLCRLAEEKQRRKERNRIRSVNDAVNQSSKETVNATVYR